MITEAQYNDIRARYDNKEAWVKSHAWEGKKWISYDPATLSADCQCSNEETSSLKVYEFSRDMPTIYTAYILKRDSHTTWTFDHYVGTWTGDHLGRIVAAWESSRSAFGYHTRHKSIVVLGDNGILYHGQFYYTAGDYVTLRAYKNQAEKKREYGIK